MDISQDEKDASVELWKRYKEWRNGFKETMRNYEAEGNQLPMKPAGNVTGDLSQFVDHFIRIVVRSIDEEFGEDFLYAQICIWDPFRGEKSINWATSKKMLTTGNKIEEKLNEYERKVEESNKSIFKIQYQKKRRETICIVIPGGGKKCELERGIGEISEIDEEIINWHSVFEGKKQRFFYYIPSTFNPGGAGIGGLMLLTEREFSEWLIVQIRETLESFLSKVGVKYQNKIVLDRSRRSAIAGIMARNMSHNIGSHVIWHIARDLKAEKNEKSKKRNLSRFSMYIQKRMDFIAQVATSEPSWAMSTKWGAMTSRLENNKALWDNIARSERIREEQIEINIKGENSTLIEIPHGRVGSQAFYTIIENVVRNASKHSDKEFLSEVKSNASNKKLEIDIEIRESHGVDEYGEFKEVVIRDNSHAGKNVKENIENKMGKKLINDKGRINEEAWGLKEIKVCSGYLRSIKPYNVDKEYENLKEDNDQPDLVSVNALGSANEGGLQYKIYIKRVKTALLVGFDVKNTNAYQEKGIHLESNIASLLDRLEEEPINHNFLVLNVKNDVESILSLRNKLELLPIRVIVCGNEGVSRSFVSSEDFEFVNTRASFCDDFELPEPGNVRRYLWDTWVGDQWWSKCVPVVRWINSEATVAGAEYGVNEVYRLDKPATQPEQTSVAALFSTEDREAVVFDHKDEADETPLYDEALYHVTFKGGSGTQELLTHAHQSLIKEFSSMTVAIIDERIWMKKDIEASHGTKKYTNDESKKLARVWGKKGVNIMDTEAASDDFEEFVRNIDINYDFLVIHQGIIEDAKAKLDNFQSVWEGLKGRCRWIVVDTGRGKPDRAHEEGLRWVEYSNLSECVVESSGDKKKLVELLTSLRAET
jgi:hypothetical protein